MLPQMDCPAPCKPPRASVNVGVGAIGTGWGLAQEAVIENGQAD
jgi:hypothetical protein